MAWEQRSGHRYYYRSQRVNGRVVKEYVGTGLAARQAAAAVEQARRERMAAHADHRKQMAQVDRVIEAIDDLSKECDHRAAAALTAAGYRQRKGEWRHTHANSLR